MVVHKLNHLFSRRNVSSAWHLQDLPPCCSASYFMLAHYFQEPPHSFSPFPSVTLSLSRSIISVHPSLVGASQRGLGCCMRGILGLWRQFGNEARLHLNTLLSGHLVNLMRGGWGEWRGEVERMEGSEERERGRGRARRVIATLREREELKRETGVKERVCGEHRLI